MLMDACNWNSAIELETFGVPHHSENSPQKAFECQGYSAENEERRLPERNDSMSNAPLDSHNSPVHFEHPVYEFEATYESPLLKDGEMFTAYNSTEPPYEANKISDAHFYGITDNFSLTKVVVPNCTNFASLTDVNDARPMLSASSPGSKENLVEMSFSSEWPVQIDDIYAKSFPPSIKMHDTVLSSVINGKNTIDKRFRNTDNSLYATRIFDHRVIQIPKLNINVSCDNNILKPPEKALTHDCQKRRAVHNSYSKHESVKHPSTSKVSHVKALKDHEYTLKIRPTSVPSNIRNGILKRSTSVPSYLELLLRCRTKLNPNLGSDCLLASDGVIGSPLRSHYKNLKPDCTKHDKNKSSRRIQIDRAQFQTSDRITSASAAFATAAKCDGDGFKALLSDAVLEDMLKTEHCSFLHAEQMGVDHILTDGFGLDSCSWVDGDLHNNGFDVFEADFLRSDVTEEHNDWLQEEQRQEDEYLKSYLTRDCNRSLIHIL